uniref:Uncharacterized protein n=1 Tax=Arundo donax TaxID=35708 RepID=A0A0A9GIE2_ARUDO
MNQLEFLCSSLVTSRVAVLVLNFSPLIFTRQLVYITQNPQAIDNAKEHLLAIFYAIFAVL